MTGTVPTREAVWARICERIADRHERIGRWCQTPVVEMTSDEEWAAAHTGVCAFCPDPARLYPSGWACTAHAPSTPEVTR